VIQSLEPWLSSEDIATGSRWSNALADALRETHAGIICLTAENLQAGWLLFEAGAISNVADAARVCVYSLDLPLSDISGPLAQFQCAPATRDDTLRLVQALNAMDSNPLPEERLHRSFDLWWPQLDAQLANIRAVASGPVAPRRQIDDMLEEMLELLRLLARDRDKGSAAGSQAEDSVTGIANEPHRRAMATRERPTVFIGSSVEGLRIAEAVQANLEHVAECTVWNQDAFAPSLTTIENLVDMTAKFDFAVVVLTPDDVLEKRGQKAPVARDNLLFELGLFTGALGRARTFLVREESAALQLPTDLLGVTAVTFKRRDDENVVAALAPVCGRIRRAMGAA
jgi:predicted nucleotide-binding protein